MKKLIRPNIKEIEEKLDIMDRGVHTTFDSKQALRDIISYLKVLEERYYFLNNTFDGTEERNCTICNKQTKRIEVNFETHLCSPECCDAMWKQYEEACKESDRKYGD